MASSYKLIWFTDPQLIPAGQINYDIDPLSRLIACIKRIKAEHHDAGACVITGDLTHWGEAEACNLLKEQLSTLDMPAYVIPGNHDNRRDIRQHFSDLPVMDTGFIQYRMPVQGSDAHLIFLDTLDAGQRGGMLCEERLQWLQQTIEKTEGVLYFFMHHPPLAVGIPNMDKDALTNAGDFWKCILPHRNRIKHIFFGHLHRHVNGSWNGISFSCLPSLVHQTPLEMHDEKPGYVSPEPPVFGIIRLHNENVLVHSQAFLHDAPQINSRTCQRYQP